MLTYGVLDEMVSRILLRCKEIRMFWFCEAGDVLFRIIFLVGNKKKKEDFLKPYFQQSTDKQTAIPLAWSTSWKMAFDVKKKKKSGKRVMLWKCWMS